MKFKSSFIFFIIILNLFDFSILDGEESKFAGITLSKSYKELTNHNPCITSRFTAEPCVMEYDNRIYVYGTNDGNMASATTKLDYEKCSSINVMSTSDLVNWSDHGVINVCRFYSNPPVEWTYQSISPSVVHKKINGKEKFFLYFSAGGRCIGVIVSESPIGPWTDPIGSPMRLHEDSYGLYYNDPSAFIDEDGSAYLYYGGGVAYGNNKEDKFRVVKLGNDMTSIEGNIINITAPWSYKDSNINKIGTTYLFSYSIDWSGSPYGMARTAYMTGNNPLGPFNFQGTFFNNPGEFFLPKIDSHHAIIKFKGKYYIFYQSGWLDMQINKKFKGHRTTHVDILPLIGVLYGDVTATLTGVEQIEYINPYQINALYTSAWQAGTSVIGTPGDITCYKRGDWNGVSGVNFSKGAKSITINGGCSKNEGAVVRVSIDSPSGDIIGYVTFPFTSVNFQTSINVTSSLITNVTGIKNIFFVASNDVFLNYYVFST